MTYTVKTTAIFIQPFELASFNEVLPAGEYQVETETMGPLDWIEPGGWSSCVLVHLHPRESHPGLSRTLTVPLAELERAVAEDKRTGKALTDYILEELLADPMICLVMQADGVSNEEIRNLFPGPFLKEGTDDAAAIRPRAVARSEAPDIRTARPDALLPGIGE